MPIEVERKFVPREGETERKLAELGAVPLGSARLQDQYYDTEDSRLTASDLWLRRRDGAWELKSPVGSPHGAGASTTQYRESVSEPEIVSLILQALGRGATADPGPSQLEHLLQGEGGGPCLAPFASIMTHRDSYHLPGPAGGARVTIDRTDFGHRVAEIEVMVGTEAEVPRAQAQIQEIAAKLGIEETDSQIGKLNVYLQKFRPRHFQRLCEAGVL
ncbi:thiamine-triphosphatase [Stegostoma tigrinum]|uniref:thiamine-triphosphatase n=1 Tax=Stegostoma tigrinum TaxID=3053191 RepID=UPI0028700CE2|nr:thiamine-triphosphatase [Stegostoma tigrinum]